MPGLGELIGTTYGPFPVDVTRERVEAFVAAIGDVPSVWADRVHPMLANAALFSVAPTFLDSGDVTRYTRSLIHSEQSYEWHDTPRIGSSIDVTGSVEAVRVRGSLNLVTFGFAAGTAQKPWVTGTSVFLMSDEAAAGAGEAVEPDENARPAVDQLAGGLTLPAVGENVAEMACGASRADLVEYAAASGDGNPIHFDHAAARDAGLEGVIVHGLLMTAWVGRAAGRYGSLHAMRVRFRNPLRPAAAATIGGSVVSSSATAGELDLALTAGDLRVMTARVSVTR